MNKQHLRIHMLRLRLESLRNDMQEAILKNKHNETVEQKAYYDGLLQRLLKAQETIDLAQIASLIDEPKN